MPERSKYIVELREAILIEADSAEDAMLRAELDDSAMLIGRTTEAHLVLVGTYRKIG